MGTEKYMSPQIINQVSYDPEKNDVFACGVILFSLLYGFPPYFKQASIYDPYYKFFIAGKNY